MFSKWDEDRDGTLTLSELFYMIKGHRRIADPFGVRFLPFHPFSSEVY